MKDAGGCVLYWNHQASSNHSKYSFLYAFVLSFYSVSFHAVKCIRLEPTSRYYLNGLNEKYESKERKYESKIAFTNYLHHQYFICNDMI